MESFLKTSNKEPKRLPSPDLGKVTDYMTIFPIVIVIQTSIVRTRVYRKINLIF